MVEKESTPNTPPKLKGASFNLDDLVNRLTKREKKDEKPSQASTNPIVPVYPTKHKKCIFVNVMCSQI